MQDPETIAAIEKLLDPNKPKPKVLYTYWLVAEGNWRSHTGANLLLGNKQRKSGRIGKRFCERDNQSN